MKPTNAKMELEKRISESGTPLSSFTPAHGIRLMLDFYRDVRTDGCELDGDGDMLLFQWGTYTFAKAKSFQLDITRQFILTEPEGDDAMSQLSFTFHFTPSPEFDALKRGERWCHTPGDLQDFEAFITGSAPYLVISTAQPQKVTLEYGGV
jgi:hypothetical protein